MYQDAMLLPRKQAMARENRNLKNNGNLLEGIRFYYITNSLCLRCSHCKGWLMERVVDEMCATNAKLGTNFPSMPILKKGTCCPS